MKKKSRKKIASHEILIERLKKSPIKAEFFCAELDGIFGESCNLEERLKSLKEHGMPLSKRDGFVFLDTTTKEIGEQIFCFVDIETNGAEIIEIGALKYRDGEILDRFESFVYAESVPEKITQITGIRAKDLENAPDAKDVLVLFKKFLGDSLFVAHNVNFDYGFINKTLKDSGLEVMLNRKLCTIDLAQRTIASPRYALSFLNAFLEINTEKNHRAYADAITAMKVFEKSIKNLPSFIENIESLIGFSKTNQKKSNYKVVSKIEKLGD